MLLAVALWMLEPVIPALVTMFGWAALLVFSAIFSTRSTCRRRRPGLAALRKGVGVVFLLSGAAMLIGALAGSRDLAAAAGGAARTGEAQRHEIACVRQGRLHRRTRCTAQDRRPPGDARLLR